MSTTINNFVNILESLAKRFESSSKTLHNRAYSLWNTVTKTLSPSDIEKAFSREYLAEDLRKHAGSAETPQVADDLGLINALQKTHTLGALEQDYRRRYLSTRKHAFICTGNQYDRLHRNLRYLYSKEQLLSEHVDTTVVDLMDDIARNN